MFKYEFGWMMMMRQHLESGIMRWDDVDPVVVMLLLSRVIVAVVETLVSIVFEVELSLWINIAMQLHIGISILRLRVVVEWDGRKWLEQVWINSFRLWHRHLKFFCGTLSRRFCLGRSECGTCSNEKNRRHKVCTIAHSTKH